MQSITTQIDCWSISDRPSSLLFWHFQYLHNLSIITYFSFIKRGDLLDLSKKLNKYSSATRPATLQSSFLTSIFSSPGWNSTTSETSSNSESSSWSNSSSFSDFSPLLFRCSISTSLVPLADRRLLPSVDLVAMLMCRQVDFIYQAIAELENINSSLEEARKQECAGLADQHIERDRFMRRPLSGLTELKLHQIFWGQHY